MAFLKLAAVSHCQGMARLTLTASADLAMIARKGGQSHRELCSPIDGEEPALSRKPRRFGQLRALRYSKRVNAGAQPLVGNPRLRPPWLGSSQRDVTTFPRVKKCTPSRPCAWVSPNNDDFQPPKE